ncbi:MAG: sigma-70 family RNA polymerase sigma factor [Phycisphaerales bacterium]|nr:MAG: sigma-70 family RNA polymerase sigma factor [Phycisphaerales bacterium]
MSDGCRNSIFPTTPITLLRGLHRAGDDGWREFFELYGPVVYRMARASYLSEHDSEDVVGVVMRRFVQVVKGGFEPRPRPQRFRDYLRTITNREIARVRRAGNGRSSWPPGSPAANDGGAELPLAVVATPPTADSEAPAPDGSSATSAVAAPTRDDAAPTPNAAIPPPEGRQQHSDNFRQNSFADPGSHDAYTGVIPPGPIRSRESGRVAAVRATREIAPRPTQPGTDGQGDSHGRDMPVTTGRHAAARRRVDFEGPRSCRHEASVDPWAVIERQEFLGLCLDRLRRSPAVRPRDFDAFRRYVLDEEPARSVASDLGLTENALYQIKHRLMRHLRQIVERIEREAEEGA